MGIEVLLFAASAVTTVASINQQKKAARAAATGRAIQTANSEYNNRLARRRAAKEARIRRGRIAQMSENYGTAGSSGELGAQSALQSNLGARLGEQQANILAVKGVQGAYDRQASYMSKANQYQALGGLFGAAYDTFNSWQDRKAVAG